MLGSGIMKAVVAFAAVLALAGAGGAWAAPRHHPPAHRHAHAQTHRRLMASAHVSYATPARPASSARRPIALSGEPSGPSEHRGWFKSHDEAGWGFTEGRTETVVGLYKRPEQPDLPGPQIYHGPEGRGAAGLAISLKLGH